MAVVKELSYTGRRLSADKALQYGLVNEVLADAAAALAAAMKTAAEIASKPPVAIWGTKQALHYARDHSVDDALKQMGWLQSGIWSNPHVKEAITAFQKKQAASFPDLALLKSFKDLA
jgi:enoyl-CoA hydratase